MATPNQGTTSPHGNNVPMTPKETSAEIVKRSDAFIETNAKVIAGLVKMEARFLKDDDNNPYRLAAQVVAQLRTIWGVWQPGGGYQGTPLYNQALGKLLTLGGVPKADKLDPKGTLLRNRVINGINYHISDFVPAEFMKGTPPASSKASKKDSKVVPADMLRQVDPNSIKEQATSIKIGALGLVRHARASVDGAAALITDNDLGGTVAEVRTEVANLIKRLYEVDARIAALHVTKAAATKATPRTRAATKGTKVA